MLRLNCWYDFSAKKGSRRRGLASRRISIECSPTPSVGARLRLTARLRRPLSPSPPCSTSKGSRWRDRRSLRASGAPPQRPGTSPCRTRRGFVPYPGLFGGIRHHHASRRAAWAQSILRQARLRAVRSNERFSNIGRLMVSHLLGLCGIGSRTATYSGHYT